MGSFSGIIQRPLVAAAAVIAASVSADVSERFSSLRSLVRGPESEQIAAASVSGSVQDERSLWVSQISASKLADLSFVSRIHVPVPNVELLAPNLSSNLAPSVTTLSALRSVYQSAQLVKASKPSAFTIGASLVVRDVSYRWHLPETSAIDMSGSSSCALEKNRTVVVLLGWLGSKQKHLKKYADWYTSQGYHVITFTLPMNEIMSYQVGGKAEKNIESLVNHLADWLDEEQKKNLVFHTFSNTGWLTYGAILEKFQKQDSSLMGRVKGCIVDSAPVAAADPTVWASGFSAALLKKNSVATKGSASSSCESNVGGARISGVNFSQPKPDAAETALLLVLEKFFVVILNLPKVQRRLADVLDTLSSAQPRCPQLYVYSSADRVIPAGQVESFIVEQMKAGHEVRACNFISSPHVDHFRSNPELYIAELNHFMDNFVLSCCNHSS